MTNAAQGTTDNRQVRLKSRPTGIPQAEHFEIVTVSRVEPAQDEVEIQNLWLSVDPAMRGWVNAAANYAKPVDVGAVMKSYAVGRIVKSRHRNWEVGALVTGLFGWQEWATVDAKVIERRLTDRMLQGLDPSAGLGILGLNGATAYFGLLDIGKPRPGDTVVVSAAAGSVGSCVGQIAKLAGCRTVGIAGGAVKTRLCLDKFGFDAAVDYKSPSFLADLKAAVPDGVDVYFDNTSGPITDAVIARINPRSRIIICGTVAHESWDPPPPGLRIERPFMVTRSRMEGFVALDYADQWDLAFKRLARWILDGKIVYQEEILAGLEAAPDSIAGMYRGENLGKRLIRLAHAA